jgi:DNA repair exonuclease SbcCD nuclease subunit
MIKALTIGDPHFMMSNLEDSSRLMDFIFKTAQERDVDVIQFTGDLFHNHAVLRQEVLNLFRIKLKELATLDKRIILLCGNHDIPGDKSSEGVFSALDNFEGISPKIIIVNNIHVYEKDSVVVGYRAYTSNLKMFLEDSKLLREKWGCKHLLAHQTFTGSVYANGFYAEDGIDPALVSQDYIISGHIHTSQQIGKCFYVGTPKWDNANDANIDKGLWLITYKKDGYDKEFISTEGIVTCIKKYNLKEGDEVPSMDSKNKNFLELEGSSAWILQTKKKLKDISNLQIKAIPTDTRISSNKENIKTINDFIINGFKPIDGISIKDITGYLEALDGAA